jgi:hypothetical protein
MIKSRVSLAQVTSLGRSSVNVMYYVCVFVRVRACVRVYVHCVEYVVARFVATCWDSSELFVRVRERLKAGGGRRE